MKKYNTQQEILFMTDSSFFRQELYRHNLPANKQSGNRAADKLEEECWNGMIREWLPGVTQAISDNKLFLWKIFVANAFLCGELSEAPFVMTSLYSLNPYLFLPTINNN